MLTVLMSTYNGANTLPLVLKIFCRLEKPHDGWKLVIVNNGSTDQTPNILLSYKQKLPLTVINEPQPGQNIARNSGLKNIEGDLVVFTDDDVLPQPDWLIQIRKVADSHPSFSIFGGNILPHWENQPEEWLLNLNWPYKGVTFALVNPTLNEGPVGPDYIVSPNMAIRAAIFKAGHRFDETIGPDGSDTYPMGSETEFIARMYKSGFKLWYSKRPVVYHIIRPYQMDKAWSLSRAVRFGRGKYLIWANQCLNSPVWQRMPRYIIRQIITCTQISIQCIRLNIAKRRGDENKIFQEQWWLNYYLGKYRQSQEYKVNK